jgi:tetratricopeptide (TPR) repeat protein
MLDLVDSLVRKSLLTATRAGGGTRFAMLETIRQFVEDQHATIGGLGELRDHHAHFYADQVVAWWDRWDGPGYDEATEWVDVEFDNLRAGFRWATDTHALATATAIASHTAVIAFVLQQFEPAGWAEELLPAAVAADVTQLPRLYTAASCCTYIGRAEDAVRYAQAAVTLQDETGYQPFTGGWASFMEAQAHSYAGRVDQWLEICTLLANQTGAAHLAGLCGLMDVLPNLGRSGDAIALTDDLMTAARANANPFWIAYASYGCGRAYTESDSQRALDNFRDGLVYTRQHRLSLFEAAIAMSSAWLEAVHGDLDEALDLFTTSLDSFHQSGNMTDLDLTFAYLMVFFDRIEQPEVAATLSGTFVDKPGSLAYASFVTHVDHVRKLLDTDTFDSCVRAGAAMTSTEAVHYAHHQIDNAR